MNKVQAKRLLNVAKALRESARPELFTMSCYVRGEDSFDDNSVEGFCGTPACALGHYASRRDLQKLLKINIKGGGRAWKYAQMVFTRKNHDAYYDSTRVLGHFGITEYEADELFGEDGCGYATTPKEAAAFIERFVAQKLENQAKQKAKPASRANLP